MSVFGKSNPSPFTNPQPSMSVNIRPATGVESREVDPQKPKRPAQPFDGLESFDLAIGEVYGLRVWRMDVFGRLRARNTQEAKPWRPGVNLAECKRDSYATLGFTRSFYASVMGYHPGGPVSAFEEEISRPKVCTAVPTEACSCGFYAYTDPKHEEAAGNGTEYVLGVIKGFGRTLLGTQGFRCEKAEIVALRDPTRGGKRQGEWRTDQLAKLRSVYPDVPLLPSRTELLAFAPIESQLPDPSTDEFWELP